ncbi:tRNA (N6-threonylcarbamoyladenosine(37)-N6)-methyltransferase TrmO [Lachnospiraceae bacterium MD308]|nr:tRNA (N6-threonylcarbamoyladenosine(37)-N6)-methyltransferase TrmO [Lachnospiraceae bacterium MD308]MCI8579837.1 tRNA (N6-threonylcarbamoyladenosine(37)-N6)-methyltransferase TrmO [Dorea sp.]
MKEEITFHRIAHIRTDFLEKFGIPRQSGLAAAKGKIIFEKMYRSAQAVRGIENYSHLWILWEFSESIRDQWSPTVRPPRLGGNERVGVFATRSPFRPNPIGLSCVRLDGVEMSAEYGPVLYVTGADLMDKTPIYDIKPYLPYADAYPEAVGGFAEERKSYRLEVVFSEQCREMFAQQELKVLEEILSQDPRPSYQEDPNRVYGMAYAGREVKFKVENGTVLVCGCEVGSVKAPEM